jgi:peptide deformylase
MSIRKIATLGHPLLRQVAKEVSLETITSEPIQRLIQDMLDTVHDAGGAGLAAPQIYESLRLVVLKLDLDDFEIWINPIITPKTDEYMMTFEGCLSVPNLRGAVVRPQEIHVTYYNEEGLKLERDITGYSAVIAQHECDHLDGIIYVDKIEPETLCFLDEYKRHREAILDFAFGPEEEESDAI